MITGQFQGARAAVNETHMSYSIMAIRRWSESGCGWCQLMRSSGVFSSSANFFLSFSFFPFFFFLSSFLSFFLFVLFLVCCSFCLSSFRQYIYCITCLSICVSVAAMLSKQASNYIYFLLVGIFICLSVWLIDCLFVNLFLCSISKYN